MSNCEKCRKQIQRREKYFGCDCQSTPESETMTDEQIKELFGFTKSGHKLMPVAEFAWKFYAKFADDEALAALEKVNEVIKETSWQPIETAPKDGTRILACSKDCIEIVKWDTFFLKPAGWLVRVNGESGFNYEERLYDATHWMPLPQLPTSK